MRFLSPRFLGLQLPRLLLVVALGLPLGASALALGEATVKSFLGQRLDAVIDIASLSPAEAAALTVRAASPEAFADAKLDYSGLIRSLKFTVDKQGERTRVRISSDLPIFDPFLILLVEVEANESRTIRQYALLFDPPPLDDTAAMGEAITPPAIQVAPAASTSPTLATPQVSAQATPEAPPQARTPSTAQASTSKAKPVGSEPSHTVRSGETLFGIASALKPAEFSVEQMMIALQSSNPDAFISKNVNRLKAGSVLDLPGADSLAALDAKQAQRQIREQRREFLRYQAALASRATSTAASSTPSTPAPAIRSNSGQVGVQLEPTPQPTVAKDQLKLSTPGKDAAGKTGLNSRQALDKIAAAKAQQEASSRIAQLEKNIDQLQQAIVVRDQNLALAQQQAKAAASTPGATQGPNSAPKAEQPAPASPPPATTETNPAASTAATTETTTETFIEATTAAAQSASALALARVQQLGKDLVLQAKAVWRSGKVQVRKALPGVKEFVDSDSGRVAIISLPLTLLLMALLWRARGKRKAAEREQAAAREEGEITPESSAFATDQAKRTASVSPLVAKGHATQPVDAIAEADVYIAYGRTEQAEDILLDALSSQPEAHAFRLKLLEIYAARGDSRAFEGMYQDLQAATRGQGSVWAQAKALSQQRLVATPAQYSAQPQRSEQGSAPSASATSPSASPLADFERKLQGMLGERQGISAVGTGSEFGSSSNTQAMPAQRIEPSLAAIDLAALQTKLELASACQEIGDYEGARELLAQVARARHPELAQRAKSLLQQIA